MSQRISKAEPESTEVKKWVQCSSMYSGRTSAVFCTKARDHGGDHRGSRAQWNASGERVPITEKEEL